MKTMDGVVRRLPVQYADGSIDLIDIDLKIYLEAQGKVGDDRHIFIF